MAFQLKIVSRGEPDRIEPLPDGNWLVGRSRSAQIQVSQPDVSGRHLLLHVDGDSVIVENLSPHGAKLNFATLELPTPFYHGQTVTLGSSLTLTLLKIGMEENKTVPPEDGADAAKAAEENMATVLPDGTSASGSAPADPDKTMIGDAPAAEDKGKTAGDAPADQNRTVPGESGGNPNKTLPPENSSDRTDAPEEEDDVLKTNVLQTRLATAEEMEFLRKQDRKKAHGKKLKYAAGIGIAAVILFSVYYFHGTPPEKKLTWPLTPSGEFSEKPFAPDEGGFETGRFSVIAPLTRATKTGKTSAGDMIVETAAGRDRDVPMRIVLSRKRSAAFLREDRMVTLQNWIREISSGGAHWNFGQPSEIFFIGRDNGLPCVSVTYSREYENQSWYGEALFFRNGDERIVRLVEIPASERIRGADFIGSFPFLFFAERFIADHWEGGKEVLSGKPEDMLNEAKLLLTKMSPVMWDKIMRLLRGVLVNAVTTRNDDLRERALEQLRKLRKNQRDWYNAQRIAYLKEKALGNDRGADVIRDACAAVFSSEDDLRNLNIRRNRWE